MAITKALKSLRIVPTGIASTINALPGIPPPDSMHACAVGTAS